MYQFILRVFYFIILVHLSLLYCSSPLNQHITRQACMGLLGKYTSKLEPQVLYFDTLHNAQLKRVNLHPTQSSLRRPSPTVNSDLQRGWRSNEENRALREAASPWSSHRERIRQPVPHRCPPCPQLTQPCRGPNGGQLQAEEDCV